MNEKTKMFATRGFRDAGLEKEFELGADLTDEPGLANYIAAGCASDVNPNAAPDAAPAKTANAKPAKAE